MRRLAVLVVGAVAALGSAGVVEQSTRAAVASGAVQSPSVTMALARFYDAGCRCYKARVSGHVSSGQAGQYVAVMQQLCGQSFGTSVAGVTTRDGGYWEAEIPVVHADALISAIYRARWEGRFSAPVSFPAKLAVTGKRLKDGRSRVTVVMFPDNPVNLGRKAVHLQRRAGVGWTRIATTRLKRHSSRYDTFFAAFPRVQGGGTVRALVPWKTAEPCFVASRSQPWRS
jgi:hypothetical protein